MNSITGRLKTALTLIGRTPAALSRLSMASGRFFFGVEIRLHKRRGALNEENPTYPHLKAVPGATYHSVSDATGRMEDDLFKFLDGQRRTSNGTGV